jgi:hypothetical protein
VVVGLGIEGHGLGEGGLGAMEEESVFEGFRGRGFSFPTLRAIWWATRVE